VQQTLAAERGDNDPKVLTQIRNQASLYEELGELDQSEKLYRKCLAGREAEMLSQQDRRAEAIPLRRRELAWSRQEHGDTVPATLTSINGLAIDLRETGALEEAEVLFRELLAGRQQVLELNDFGFGRTLGGLAKTLEKAGKLEEAVVYGQQAYDHRFEHEGPNAWWTNLERLDLARVLHKLRRSAEALSMLEQLEQSMNRLDDPDESDRSLLDEAKALKRQIKHN